MGASPPVLRSLASLPVTGRLAPCRYRISKHVLSPVVDAFDRLGVRYYVGGSVASSTHVAGRSTLDVDVVAELDEDSRVNRRFSSTKTPTTNLLASMASSLSRTVAAMTTPCSANTHGGYRRPPRPAFEVADCDLKSSNSTFVS
jgi:hypothetical protein